MESATEKGINIFYVMKSFHELKTSFIFCCMPNSQTLVFNYYIVFTSQYDLGWVATILAEKREMCINNFIKLICIRYKNDTMYIRLLSDPANKTKTFNCCRMFNNLVQLTSDVNVNM